MLLYSQLISLEATSLSSTNVRMAIREVLVPGDTDASNTKYDATNNWSELGARGIGSDVSEPLDIIVSQVGENEVGYYPNSSACIISRENKFILDYLHRCR